MKQKLIVLFVVLVLITTACAPAATPTPQTVTIVVTATPEPTPIATPTPTPMADPPMLTATGPVDCRPYPSFDFLYIAGIDNGESVPVLNKGEQDLSDPGDDWWLVHYEEGGAKFDCWVYSRTYTEPSGDFSGLEVKKVIIPPPPKNHCDTAVKLAKAQPGVKVRLPHGQAMWMGRDGWFDGMWEYAGKIGRIIDIAGLDLSWCQTVYVEVYGWDTGYPWRVRDLDFSVKKGD